MANFFFFAAVPTLLFWVWYFGDGNDHIPAKYHLLDSAVPMCGIWVTIAPIVFRQGELIFEELLSKISTDGEQGGWDVVAAQCCIDKIDRCYQWLASSLAVLIGGGVGYVMYEIRDIAPLVSTSQRIGSAVVLLSVGHVSATGIWGCAKVLLVVRTLTKSADLRWNPFRPAGDDGFQYLFRFAWINAVFFSLSNLTVPALLVVWPRLGLASRVVVGGFIVLMSVGGLGLFSLTTWWLNSLSRGMQDRALGDLSPHIETLASKVTHLGQLSTDEVLHLRHSLDVALSLQRHMAESHPAPQVRTIFRASTTMLLPIFLLVIQIAVQKWLS
ncbi:hypothetical protein [Streptomyces albicerus]|uniref:hypothetical protein n=1 Tax=Streptomyces albicerus TaxID=2569859 RepID=UPI00124B8AE2|nr:hypothetical protein [Streptomyces albicerus]